MSGIGGLFDIPRAHDDINVWAFYHQAHHRDINRVLYERFTIALPEYIFDPMNPADVRSFGLWTYQNQLLHEQINAILGIQGQNLLELDWYDQEKQAVWIGLHAQEHRQYADVLGIG